MRNGDGVDLDPEELTADDGSASRGVAKADANWVQGWMRQVCTFPGLVERSWVPTCTCSIEKDQKT